MAVATLVLSNDVIAIFGLRTRYLSRYPCGLMISVTSVIAIIVERIIRHSSNETRRAPVLGEKIVEFVNG